MKATRLALMLLLIASAAPGCRVTGGRQDTPGWLSARGADFMDVFGIRAGLGPGLGAYARATEYLQLGFIKKGPGERDLPAPKGGSPRAFPCFMFGTIGRYGGAWFEGSTEVMFPAWSSRDRERTADSPLAIEREVLAGYVSPHGELDMWRESFGLGAYVLLVGVEAEVRPYQLFDFLAGVAGFDPAGDDMPADSGAAAPTVEPIDPADGEGA
ncbi:MAG: hypothetical protein DRQ55_10030 [Planctomycetota bacterium]|nr:MAG: hypothetical protein DRQ55_10030 [Planctomycetota bacterium]